MRWVDTGCMFFHCFQPLSLLSRSLVILYSRPRHAILILYRLFHCMANCVRLMQPAFIPFSVYIPNALHPNLKQVHRGHVRFQGAANSPEPPMSAKLIRPKLR